MIDRRGCEAGRGQFYPRQHNIGMLALPCHISAIVHRMLVDSYATVSSALCLVH